MPDRLITPSLEGLYSYFESRRRSCENDKSIFSDCENIRKTVEEIAKRVGNIKDMRPARDRLQESVALVFTKGIEHALSTHFRYVCWALHEAWGQRRRCILDEDSLFSELGTALENTCYSGGMVPRYWRGLLEAYFLCEIKQKNHKRLRDILNNTLPFMLKKKFIPEWLILLNEHPNLLSESPTERYAGDVLAGRFAVIDQLRDGLNIPLDSWFWRDLLLSQIRVVRSKGNEQFLTGMEILIPQLEKEQYLLVRDDGLAMLLGHYEQRKIRGNPPVVLKDSVLRWWGSPHLERNTKWGLVRPETKKMVQGWFTVQAIGDFFTLLQEDQRADERRLKFWLRYQLSIEFFYFALGPLIYNSNEADYRKMRQDYKGHFCKLTSPGMQSNNAFIFQIGDYFIVEFGMIGNACFCYKNDSLPFHWGDDSVNLNRLKNANAAKRWLHKTHWEHNFEYELSNLGIFPSTSVASPIIRRRPASNPVVRERFDTHSNCANAEARPKTEADVKTRDVSDAFVVTRAWQRGIRMDDKRPQGGALWIFHLEGRDEFAKELHAAGFLYHPGRGWWRK